jgi:Glycosyl hydrolases family 28/Bacterial Ig-like domain (group 3)
VVKLPNHLPSRIAAALVLSFFSFAAGAQDRRTVVEPTFPPTCTTLAAQLPIVAGEPSSETAFDTSRIQAALNSCGSGKSVELIVSGANDAFLVQPLTLPSGVGLIVDGGVTVFASRNPADYQVTGAETCGTVGTAGDGCKNLITPSNGSSIMGYGVIDGRGEDKLLVNGVESTQNWWDIATAANNGSSSQNNFVLLETGGANSFTLYKITLRNSPMFHVVWKGSGLTAWGVKIATPYTARNTDGIDPSGSDVTITRSYISDGDDDVAVSASSASSFITVSNLQTYSGHGISVGSFTKGGLTNFLVENVNMAGTAADGNANGLRLKSAQDRGGLVQNVTYQNLCIKDVAHALEINPFYVDTTGTLVPQFENIVLRNVHFLSEGKVELQGHDASHPTTLTLDNVVFDNLKAADLSPAPQFAAITLGPGAVFPQLLQTASGTGVTESGSAPASNATPFDCTGAFPQLAGELFLSGNLSSLTLTGPASFTLQATLQPAMSQVSYGAWTGVPALTSAVNFLEGATVVGAGQLGANGTLATLNLTNVGGGTHTYTAQYPGDANYPAFAFGSVTVTVNGSAQAAAVTQLDAPATATFGDLLTLTAAVSGNGATPTGSVQFAADGASLGTGTLVNGSATLAISTSLSAGTHSLIVNYGGDATYSSSASAPQQLTVAKAPATVSFSVPQSPVLVNTPIQLSASVPAPDGSITFLNGPAQIGTVAVSNGAAVLRVTPAALGALTLSASYSGGANFLPATSAPQTLSVVAPFTIAATPSAASLPSQVSIALTPQAGFNGQVDLSCASSSTAVSCSLSQSSVTLSAPATVTASLSSNPLARLLVFPTALPAAFFFIGKLGKRRRRRYLALFALLAAACSKGSAAPSSSVVTVTARSGATSVSTQIAVD